MYRKAYQKHEAASKAYNLARWEYDCLCDPTRVPVRVLDTSTHDPKNDPADDDVPDVHGALRPDLCVYFGGDSVTDRPDVALSDAEKDKWYKDKVANITDEESKSIYEHHSKCLGKASLADVLVPIEVKADPSDSAFTFPGITPAGKKANKQSVVREPVKSHGQVNQYCAAILERQHRTKLIALYVCRYQARIIVVDHGSFIISEPFGWRTKDDTTLYEFFWRVALLSSGNSKGVLGLDPSVTRQSSTLRPGLRDEWVAYISRKMRLSMPTSQWPFYRLSIGGKKYLIAAPSTTTSALFGPSRRIFIAYCEDDDELRTVKDYWRLDSDDPIPLEHDTYARLALHKVRNVPECVCGEDVRTGGPDGDPQRTATLDRWGPNPKANTLVHYRIVLKQVYKPLLNFGDFRSLCGYLVDAMEAHLDACEKARVIHRSISIWSVGLYVFPGEVTQPRCLLGDWEWAKTQEEIAQKKARREGAWYFQSALVARFPARGYAISDDVESFVHLFQYTVLRFTPTVCTPLL
ncbi:uncharacterized protein BXZ73DRAFT_54683, partial [Epithele typhae]|uniref:uncharacterized protein n=1 Tax=Epithele typhae TaxID=378194 RepID=UPI002008B3DD